MKINLNVSDRLTLITILPTSGRIVDLVEVIDMIKLLKFTDEERQDIEMKEDEGRLYWNISKEISKEIELNFEQIRIIKSTIKDLDDTGKVDLNILNTCLKFNKL